MRTFLLIFFSLILFGMLAVTTWASFDRDVITAAGEIWEDPWGRATLFDAYFGFFTIYLWIAWREPTWARRGLWFVLLMCLGNIAIAVYGLMTAWRLRPEDGPQHFLLPKKILSNKGTT